MSAALEATLGEIARVGYAALRLEDVADRAGVAKTTLYRRWPTKAALVFDAIRGAAFHETIPDTGSLRGDILVMLERIQRKLETPEGRALARLVSMEGASREDKELEALFRQLKDELRAQRNEVIVRAKARGLLPEDADGGLILDTVYGVVVSRLLRYGERTDRPTCERLVDLVITGAEHGGGTLRGAPRAKTRT